MERALDLALLRGALGERTGLPTAEQLQDLLANAETQLFLRRSEISDDLLGTAWYLHSVASVSQARERYTLARQRQAFAVSAHIFDLALQGEGRWTRTERLTFGFAAAIGYRRGGQDPNATAVFNNLRNDITIEPPVLDHIDTLALEAGLAFLSFETRTLFSWFGAWRRQLGSVAELVQLDDLTTTAYGTTDAVIRGADDLLHYLARGSATRRSRAEALLLAAALGESGPGEPDARWVAAHLLTLSGEAIAGSVWNPSLLPPDLPNAVRHSFTMASPPVLTLWEPQRELLTRTPSPFAADVRRLALSVPTSGGKTLVAQLLSVAHLAAAPTSVCYVSPTRTLGREVRRAMASRLRILQKEVGTEQPDHPAMSGSDPFDLLRLFSAPVFDDRPPDVDVMTPERLANLLRHDADAVLARFGLFIFDEAQLIKERGRGFTLESTISYLHFRTQDSAHRIVLISAAMGNAGQVAQWLDPSGSAQLFESQWRGPRRLHALFGTAPRWTEAVSTRQPRKQEFPYRLGIPLHGSVRLRLSDGRPVVGLETTQPIGTLVLKAPTDTVDAKGLKKDSSKSTKNYEIASAMIEMLGHAGSVLVVAPTRPSAQRLAQALAGQLDENPATAPIVEFVRGQLGDDHPLVNVLRHGVGFHHAGLPIEVLEAIEEAVRLDLLRFLTCTSTLTDGVNLPVRTVVIYDETYEGMPEDLRLQGARLVNAMGRAGRAGKETEGWIILVRAAASEVTFDDLNPSQDQLTITSTLATDTALEVFAELEAAQRDDQDALFSEGAGIAAGFIGFIWFVLAAGEATGTPPENAELHRLIDSTLAAHQLTAHQRAQLEAVAESVRLAYQRTDPAQRRSWARTGTSIGTARQLYVMANEVFARIMAGDAPDLTTPQPAIHLLAELGIIDRLLALPENETPWQFRASANGVLVPVSAESLLADWISGKTLTDMANTHLAAESHPAWRIERLVDSVSMHFEHYLAWTLGALTEMVNSRLSDANEEVRLCTDLGTYVRYGVADPRALIMMTSGVRSRGLANRIVTQLPPDLPSEIGELQKWLNNMSLTEWRSRFGATNPEILDLLDLTRDRGRSLLRSLLETGSVPVVVHWAPEEPPDSAQTLALRPVEGEPAPASTGVYADDVLRGRVTPKEQADVHSILETGMDLDIEIDSTATPNRLMLRLPAGFSS